MSVRTHSIDIRKKHLVLVYVGNYDQTEIVRAHKHVIKPKN